MSDAILLHVVSGAERLTEFRVSVEAAFAKSASDYWTLALVRRRFYPDGTTPMLYGETIATYALNVRMLPAKERIALYSNEQGLAMADSERLYLSLAATGSPAALTHLTWELDVQKVTR